VKGSVVYWMSRDQRIDYNWALYHAIETANRFNTTLEVVLAFNERLTRNPNRHYALMLEGLYELSVKLTRLGVKFVFIEGDPGLSISNYVNSKNVGYLITDFSPLKNKKQWIEKVIKETSVPFDEVDTHNIVPIWITSQKQEFGAHTIRPKIHKLLPKYLELFELPIVENPIKLLSPKLPSTKKEQVSKFIGGEDAAKKILEKFLDNKLQNYDSNRNNPNIDGQSELSPYIHFGNISSLEIALRVIENAKIHKPDFMKKAFTGKMTSNTSPSEEAFLEELIVRKELADNFCYYNNNYDNFNGLPEWSKKELILHSKDERDYIYSYSQFENALTHDDLWNSAQKQMTKTGKMHGYLRMYWAKKILEWSKSPQEAVNIAVRLNDKYELDGRDPNGYVGVLWSIGGLHDRPWFERKVFGKIRFMNRSGCEKKFDVERYISEFSQ